MSNVYKATTFILLTTARMKELPGCKVAVLLGEDTVVVGDPPPDDVGGGVVVPVGLELGTEAAPGRH